MDLRTDRDSPLPLGDQLAEQIRQAIEAGELGPGESLPTIREAAEAVGVNVNTVAGVYRQLEREGYLVQRRRAGTRVAGDPPRRPERALAALLADRALAQAAAAGLGAKQVAVALLAGSLRRAATEPKVRVAALAAGPLAAAQLASKAAEALGGAVEAVPVTPREYRSVDYHLTLVAPELAARLSEDPLASRRGYPVSDRYGTEQVYGPDFPAGAD